jgi:hypothetical protein
MKSTATAYSQFRKSQSNDVLRQKEIPVEHYISLPLPVHVNGKSAYAYFACPTRRTAGEPGTPVQVEYGGIDRRWVLAAESGNLLQYNRVDEPPPTTILSPVWGQTVTELKAILTRVDQLMDELAPRFFAAAAGDDSPAAQPTADQLQRRELLQSLQTLIPPALMPAYQTTAGEFFGWLSR